MFQVFCAFLAAGETYPIRLPIVLLPNLKMSEEPPLAAEVDETSVADSSSAPSAVKPAFIPLDECDTEELRRRASDVDRANYDAKMLFFKGDYAGALKILLPWEGKKSSLQREIAESIAELRDMLRLAEKPASGEVGVLDAQSRKRFLDHFDHLVKHQRCVYGWRRLAIDLEHYGGPSIPEVVYIRDCIVKCLTVRDRPYNAASGQLRKAADDLKSIGGLPTPSPTFPGGSSCRFVDDETSEAIAEFKEKALTFFNQFFVQNALYVFGGRKFEPREDSGEGGGNESSEAAKES